jgi:hypothetical protein
MAFLGWERTGVAAGLPFKRRVKHPVQKIVAVVADPFA